MLNKAGIEEKEVNEYKLNTILLQGQVVHYCLTWSGVGVNRAFRASFSALLLCRSCLFVWYFRGVCERSVTDEDARVVVVVVVVADVDVSVEMNVVARGQHSSFMSFMVWCL